METLKIAAAYVRVSTDDQVEYSPDSQIAVIRERASKDGYIVPEEYVFQDDAISGKRADKRPQFMMLIAQSKEAKPPFDRIYVWEFSRFARNQEESIVYKNLLRKKGISVLSIKEPLADSPFASLIERIIEWMDEYYLINLATEVRRGMEEKAKRGEAMGNAPYGYRIDSGNKSYAIVPEEADIVRYIYAQYLSGSAVFAIAEDLNAKGLKTRRGKPVSVRWVRYILQNPIYCGKIRWSADGKIKYNLSRSKRDDSSMIHDGKHAPIVSEETFETVQERFRAIPDQKGKTRKYPEYMLRGLVYCDTCGSVLTRRMTQYGKPALQCSGFARGACAVSHFIVMDTAEEAVLSYLREAIKDGTYTFVTEPSPDPKPEIDYDKLIASERHRIARAREAYLDGTFTSDEYKDAREASERNIAMLQASAHSAQEKKKADTPAKYRKRVRDVIQLLQAPKQDAVAKNRALHSIIERIVFHKPSGTFSIYFKA